MHLPPLLLSWSFKLLLLSLPTPPSLAECGASDDADAAYHPNVITEPDSTSPPPKRDTKATLELELTATNYTILALVDVIAELGNDNKPTQLQTRLAVDTGSNLIWINASNVKKKPTSTPQPATGCHPDTWPLKDEVKVQCTKQKCDRYCVTCDRYCVTYDDRSCSTGKMRYGHFVFHRVSDREVDPNDDPSLCVSFGNSTKADGNIEGHGVLGLGRGSISLAKQVANYYADKFSYCLPSPNSSTSVDTTRVGQLRFGKHLSLHEKKTELLLDPEQKCKVADYCVQLKNVNGYQLCENKMATLIIDSGTTFTYLTHDLFVEFKKELMKSVHLKDKKPVEKLPKDFDYQDCFKVDKCKDLSEVTASLGLNDTTIHLKYYNIFDCVRDKHDKYYGCLTVQKHSSEPSSSKKECYEKANHHKGLEKEEAYGPSLLGSRAQTGFNVTFDLTKQRYGEVSFDSKGCSSFEGKEPEPVVLDLEWAPSDKIMTF